MARRSWLDEDTQTTLIDNYAKQLGSFVEAMADGQVDEHELTAQEKQLVALMKKIEPKLDDQLHDEVTELLCELSAYNIMQTLHELAEARPVSKSAVWRP